MYLARILRKDKDEFPSTRRDAARNFIFYAIQIKV